MGMYRVRHWWGKQERNYPTDRFSDLVAELAGADKEHPSCSLEHESGWVLSYSRNRKLIFENVETGKRGEERHMLGVAPETVVELWTYLAAGDLARVEAQPWLPGYGQ
jgi:hypothetical protein